MKRLLACALLLLPLGGLAATALSLPRAPIDPHDKYSLQRGARAFVNYCLNCHGAAHMRYSRLKDLGLTEEQIKTNLLLTGGKVGDLMTVAMPAQEAKEWFGVVPPDLSVIARSRGVDWLYGYLRGFYRDDSKVTGWNNLVFPNVAMPHVLYDLQGEQKLEVHESKDEAGHKHEERKLVLAKPGRLTPAQYDAFAADLVNYLAYMSEPVQNRRVEIGIKVLFFLALLFPLTLMLKKQYWKDVH